MKCKISFVALSSVLSIISAVSVDHFPHNHHAQPYVKYIEPDHVKTVNYVQPNHVVPVAPLIKHVAAAPVKYVHPQPHAVKYVDSPQYVKHVEHETAPAQYEFGYDVSDPHTGDVKSHSEKRDGHSVQGRYEVLDPDGFKRIVEYTADEHNGFNAVVRREPVDVKVIKKVYEPEVVKHVAPIAPVKYYAPQPEVAPVKYYAPQPEIAPVKYFASQPEATAIKYYAPQLESYVAPAPKLFAPTVHQKVIAPVVKQYVSPQYYAPPEHPKLYGKPIEAITKFVKPTYQYEPQHTAVKYVTPHYNH